MTKKAIICGMFLAFTQYALVNSLYSEGVAMCWEKANFVIPTAAEMYLSDSPTFPFINPCNKCIVRNVVADAGQPEDLKVTYIKENHTTITEGTVVFTKYELVCNCTIKHNDDQILSDFLNHDKDNSDSTCTKIHQPKHTYNETAMKQCLNSKFEEKVEQSSHTTINISVTGTDMIIKYTMMRPPADPDDKSGKMFGYDNAVTVNEIEKVHVLNQEVTFEPFPTIDCHYPEDSEFSENMVRLCDCMQDSKIFESLPEIAVHLAFNCDLNVTFLGNDLKDAIKYLSCGYDYDKDKDDK